jgi:glutamyl-Q tRNA(Asp) synthetase
MRSETQRHVTYRGRFAPTPSGPLHLGSLVTALGSYCRARSLNGRWLLRIDDLDRPRVVPGAEDTILRQLEAHGLTWDEVPRRQSEHVAAYEDALSRLAQSGALYACTCTRATLRRVASAVSADEPVYAGTCRHAGHPFEEGALRLRVGEGSLELDDGGPAPLRCALATDLGDFVVRRRDGQIGYQLACTVDEAAQRITEVVRGADLVTSSLRQVHLMHRLGLPVPAYRHLPVLVDAQGRKLSKQNHAPPVNPADAPENLRRALACLGQAPVEKADPPAMLRQAVADWDPDRIPSAREIRT